MADQSKTGSIYPIEPNPLLDAASRGTGAVRKFLNREYRPDVPKGGLGDLLLGRSPEELNKWAYGFHPFNDLKDWARTGPIQEQRQSGVADVAMLPVSEALGAAGLATKGLGSLARGAIEGSTNLGRRQFLQNAGTATAGAAIAVPALLRGLGEATEHAAPKAVEGAATRVVSPHDYHAMRAQAELKVDSALRDGETGHWDATHHKAHSELLDDLHSKVEPYPTHREINQKYNANTYGDDEYVAEHLKQGWLPDKNSWVAEQYPNLETVESRLQSSGNYVDPFSGNRAILRDGEVSWTNGLKADYNPSGFHEARYQGWLEPAHTTNARKELGLSDEYGKYIGPERKFPPQRFSDPGLPELEPNYPDYGEFKRGGFIERTTRSRKIL
jgi:hypothetical protein